MSPKIILYGIETSPPVRTVLLTLKALKLDYTFHELNIKGGELTSPEYLKKNPEHTVPTLEDDGKYLVDSHAISAYLVRKYAKDDSLYPKDFYQRAIVDHRLHYENGVMFSACLRPAFRPLAMGELNKEKFADLLKQIDDIYSMLQVFLGNNQYIAGNELTIADFSILATLTSMALISPLDEGIYPKLTAWLERMQKLPYYEEANARGVQKVLPMIADKLEKLR